MTNAGLAQAFSELALLMEYRGEDGFKIRSYRKAADLLKKGNVAFAELSRAELLAVEGIGKAIADKIAELNDRGELSLYRRLADETPAVALDLLGVKGLGPKKVKQLVTELGVESVGELVHAADENRVAALKGWSAASQAKLYAQLTFFQDSQHQLRYASALPPADALLATCREHSPRVELTGQLRRQAITVDAIELLAVESDGLREALRDRGFEVEPGGPGRRPVATLNTDAVRQVVYLCAVEEFELAWLSTTGSAEFLTEHPGLVSALDAMVGAGGAGEVSEGSVFAKADMPYVPAPQREAASPYPPTPPADVIQPGDIRGIVHAHTTASDGSATLAVLAKAVQDAGYAYLTVTDHSRAAFYANGLTPARLRAQATEIEDYNREHPGFRVFKGTECDILRDGRLDFADEVLAELDIVIASVHSVLAMSPADATERLIRAVENPYVTMLGHPTGRLLLSREGYRPDMSLVLAACAEHEVAVEINASALRLDLDWTHVPLAVALGVRLSINPDAHSVAGIDSVRWGVAAAQKAGLRKEHCLNCLEADAFGEYLLSRRRRKGI